MVGGAGKKADIKGRVEQIRTEMETTDSDYDREKLQERLAKLAGGVAQINCGAATETEMKERKALLEDAKSATAAALEEGVVPGGGVTLMRSSKHSTNWSLRATKPSVLRLSAMFLIVHFAVLRRMPDMTVRWWPIASESSRARQRVLMPTRASIAI